MELYRSAHGKVSMEEYAGYLARLITGKMPEAEKDIREAKEAGCHERDKNSKGKPDMLIVREKQLTEEEYLELFESVWEKCRNDCMRADPLTVIPHTYLAAAEKTGSSCIHLPLPLLRKYHGMEKFAGLSHIGVSVHSIEEAKEAEQLGAAYVTAGHIFSTNCKPGVPPRGIAFLEQVCGSVSIPVYAIGGVHPENLTQIQCSGAAGACMMSEFMGTVQPSPK